MERAFPCAQMARNQMSRPRVNGARAGGGGASSLPVMYGPGENGVLRALHRINTRPDDERAKLLLHGKPLSLSLAFLNNKNGRGKVLWLRLNKGAGERHTAGVFRRQKSSLGIPVVPLAARRARRRRKPHKLFAPNQSAR
jgi:hypothetical protein